MSDRKRYSVARQRELWLLVDKAIVDFRLHVLRGGLTGRNVNGQEDVVYKALGALPDKVCAEYRRSYSTKKPKADF